MHAREDPPSVVCTPATHPSPLRFVRARGGDPTAKGEKFSADASARNRPAAARRRPFYRQPITGRQPTPAASSPTLVIEIKAGRHAPGLLLAEGGVSCLKSCLAIRTCSLVSVAVSSAGACASGSATVRPACVAAVSCWLSAPGAGSPLRRTGARRRSAPESARPASAPRSATRSAGASCPSPAITRPRPRERPFVVSAWSTRS